MDDARRFLRYLTPGLVFVIEAWLLANWWKLPDAFRDTLTLLKGEGLGAAGSLFILSGGLGFMFSLVHHLLYWKVWAQKGFAPDPTPALKAAVSSRSLLILDAETGRKRQLKDLTPASAWQIFNAVWHERLESSSQIRAANERANSLADVVHNTGTVLVAAFFATSWALVVTLQSSNSDIWKVLLAGFAVVSLHYIDFRVTVAMNQGVINTVFVDTLSAERVRGGASIVYDLTTEVRQTNK